jgi:hypothetical protein
MMQFSGAGAKTSQQRLPLSYYEAMDKFLAAFKKETTLAKKDGMLDEQEADPILWTLFQNILQWALDRKNIYLWVFSILQWNCMARSINIGVLALHCFRVGKYCMAVRSDKSKVDQSGEKVSNKHVYDNPFDPLFWFLMPSGFGSLLNPLVLNIRSLCFKGTKTKTMLLHNATVHSCPSFSKPSMTSWSNSSKPTTPKLMEF